MNIEQFKEGDLITRIKRTTPRNVGAIMFFTSPDVGDGSYIGDKLELIGHDESTIMCVLPDKPDKGKIDLSKFLFDDDGWGYWPHPLWKKAEDRIGELLTQRSKE